MRKQMKNFDELMYRDNFMFVKIMKDPELCREVLECLLQRPISELTEIQTEKEIECQVDGKPIRLDVFNKDNEGNIYDTEMQNLNKQTVGSHALPKRSRYYQSTIDNELLGKGDEYRNLPESNILFICTFDPFGLGMGRYTFRERCEEEPELFLQSGTLKVFFNCCYDGDDLPKDLRCFYKYVETGIVGNNLTGRIDAAVDKGKKNKAWRSQFMRERLALQDAKDEGREEGRFEIVEHMIRRGKTPEEISDDCDIPIERVREIEQNMMASAK